MKRERLPENEVAYYEARDEIRDLDIIGFEGRGPVSRAISLLGGGPTTHVGLALWWGESLMLVESREMRGARIVWLSREVQNAADRVAWYRPRERHGMTIARRHEAIDWLRRVAGSPYSYRGVLRYGLRMLHLPSSSPDADSFQFGNRFCSELVSAAWRMAGLDLRPDLADSQTSPQQIVVPTECLGRLVVPIA